jgi:hypothetical protein
MHMKQELVVDEIALLMSFVTLASFSHIMQCRLFCVGSSDDFLVRLVFAEQRNLIATYAVMLFCIYSVLQSQE